MDSHSFIEAKIAQRPILLIGKAYDPLSREVAQYLGKLDLNKGNNNIFEALYIDQRQDVSIIDTYIYQKWLTKCRTVRRHGPIVTHFLLINLSYPVIAHLSCEQLALPR